MTRQRCMLSLCGRCINARTGSPFQYAYIFLETGFSGVWSKATILVGVGGGWGGRVGLTESHGDSPLLYCLHHTQLSTLFASESWNDALCFLHSLHKWILFATKARKCTLIHGLCSKCSIQNIHTSWHIWFFQSKFMYNRVDPLTILDTA